MMTARPRLAHTLVCIFAAFACFAAGAYAGAKFLDVFTEKNPTADALVGLGTDLAAVNRMREGKTDEAIELLRADMERHVLTLIHLEKEKDGDPHYDPQKRRLLAGVRKDLAEHPRAKLTFADAEIDASYQEMQKELHTFLEKYP